MKLPNAERAVVEERKITEYLLSFTSPDGRTKAEFFTRFGFQSDEWEVFAEMLRSHCLEHEVYEFSETGRGVKYVIIGTVRTPDGRNPNIKSIWQIDHGADFPRLISAYRAH